MRHYGGGSSDKTSPNHPLAFDLAKPEHICFVRSYPEVNLLKTCFELFLELFEEFAVRRKAGYLNEESCYVVVVNCSLKFPGSAKKICVSQDAAPNFSRNSRNICISRASATGVPSL